MRRQDKERSDARVEAARQRRRIPPTRQRHPRLNLDARARVSPFSRPRAREGIAGTTLASSVTDLAPHNSRLFGEATPGPDTTLRPDRASTTRRSIDALARPSKQLLDTKRIRSGVIL